MLFGTYSFIFLFLPCFLFAWRFGPAIFQGVTSQAVFLGFSLLFYAFQGLPWLALLLALASANYFLAALIRPDRNAENKNATDRRRKLYLVAILLLNLLPLLWFKYSWFIVQNLAPLFDSDWNFTPPGLPLGVSFYTFIQIAWIIGVYRGEFAPATLNGHLLFSCCFPYVISGPIVRYQQTGWQLEAPAAVTAATLARGCSLFIIGLAKKILLADNLGDCADVIFRAAQYAWPLSSMEAWAGSLCYTFQLYFDFSGYTDMALGIGLMIGLKLPVNFNSPYKSTGIVDFWRRWHITLGAWLRDFLYIPMGGNRKGRLRQYLNLFATMLIGGIWHGAGWTFAIWGALHGLLLCANHFFRSLLMSRPLLKACFNILPARVFFILLTFLCLNLCWVVFRAPSLDTALRIYTGMFVGSAPLPFPELRDPGLWQSMRRWLLELAPHGYVSPGTLSLLAICMCICWLLPNSSQIFQAGRNSFLCWRSSGIWAACLGVLMFVSLLFLSENRAFLYFQF